MVVCRAADPATWLVNGRTAKADLPPQFARADKLDSCMWCYSF